MTNFQNNESKVERANQLLEHTLTLIRKEHASCKKSSSRLKKADIVFKILIAIFGVAAPALVTYQTQTSRDDLKLAAILMTAFAGASATLQGTFSWDKDFKHKRVAEINLEVLAIRVDMERSFSLGTNDPDKAYLELISINEKAINRFQEILETQVLTEVEIVTNQEQLQKKQPLESKSVPEDSSLELP